ncbi:TonB-dependent receptor [Sphingomonas naasensis]|uniref:TonB-dependent receptor n=1 Tax=Sphingomonas naasensis TaxID=1344951 RepID=A0A4V3QWQ1_9SPHN|nr:TonB-dependent receptor [Sphingomonas naasensis]NIJ20922.1 TonB-dependent receptor [Sphingomonas naasensis]TGX43312.1 TonB-dependent receptor [Sphingomonas naasensis]
MALKRRILCSASLVALVSFAAPAAAQTDPAPSQTADTTDQQNDEIVVTGVRASLIEGLQNKREATQVIESVVAEDVGKLPDNNVVEALQRVTGVQVTNRTGGEASAISIRGLPDITTTWNGRNIFTASGRQFALADIPANLVKRIDVYKTRAAEQIETGIAGQVDVFTRRPLDFDGFAFSAVARGIYNEQADTFNPNISALISNRWETGAGDIGVLVNVSYAKTKYRDQSVTAGAMVPFATATNPPAGWTPLERIQPTDGRAPGQQLWTPGLQPGLPSAPGSTLTINGAQVPYYLSRDAVFMSDLYGERERPAVNAALQWAPNDSSKYTFEFFWDGYRNTTFNNLFFTFVDWWGNLGPNPAGSFTLYPDTNIMKTRTVGAPFEFNSGDATKQSTDSFVYALNGEWNIGERFKLAADASYQKSEFNTAFLAMRTTRVANSVTVDFNQGGGLTAFQFDNNLLLRDPNQWTVGEFYDNANRNKGNAWTASIDGDYDVGSFLKTISFGARWDKRNASEASRGQDAPALGRPLTSLDPGFQFYNKPFFDGRSNVPRTWVVANGYYLFDHADDVRALYRSTVDPGIETSDTLSLNENFNIDETTWAAYLQGDFELGPLRLQAGVRYVNVKTEMNFLDAISGNATAASASTDEFLPSVTLRYDITNNLRLRFNYGKTLRRPNFVDLNPNLTLTGDLTNVGYGSGSGGNPDLRPTRATNYDLGAEWYFENDSAIYATLFRREIDGLVVPFRSIEQVTGTGLNTTTFIINRPTNASEGVLKGAEIGLVYFPTLPGLLNGLGVQGSVTFLDSKQNIPIQDAAGNTTGEVETSFFGVSDLSYNVTLAYDNGPVGARLSYVWRKEFLNNNEASLFANPIGIWRRPEKSLDLQLTAKVNDRLAVTLDAVNLTEELSQSYYAFGDAGGPDTDNFGSSILGRTFALGLRYSFD